MSMAAAHRAREALDLLAAATPGPWHAARDLGCKDIRSAAGSVAYTHGLFDEKLDAANAAFIAAIPADLGDVAADAHARVNRLPTPAHSPISPQRRRAMKARLAAISPLPWRVTRRDSDIEITDATDQGFVSFSLSDSGHANANLVAAAPHLLEFFLELDVESDDG